jgi:hypothetical protein
MAGVVGKEIQHHIAMLTAPGDKVLLILPAAGDAAEETQLPLPFMLERLDIR